MAGSVNKVILLGNIGRDPEIRTTQNGGRIANISIATSESWKDKTTGERKENTQWHRVVIFNDALVGIVEKYVRKGSKIYVEGALETRKWTDTEGKDNYSTEVVLRNFGGTLTLLDSRPSDCSNQNQVSGGGYNQGGRSEAPAFAGQQSGGNYATDLDDDIPF